MFPLGIVMSRELTIPAETIFFGVTVTVGIATLNPRLNMDYPLSGIYCVSALHVWRATSRSPLQLRDVTQVHFIDVIPAYFVDLQYAM